MQQVPNHRPILRKQTGTAEGNIRPPGSRPEPWIKRRENAALWPALLRDRSQPNVRGPRGEFVPRLNARACPRSETVPRTDEIPSPNRESRKASQEQA